MSYDGNLILGETKELKSRYLLVGLKPAEKDRLKKGCLKRLSEKGCQKTADKLLALLKAQPQLTQAKMAEGLGISRQAVQKHLANLKAFGRLRRIGPDKGGHWEVRSSTD